MLRGETQRPPDLPENGSYLHTLPAPTMRTSPARYHACLWTWVAVALALLALGLVGLILGRLGGQVMLAVLTMTLVLLLAAMMLSVAVFLPQDAVPLVSLALLGGTTLLAGAMLVLKWPLGLFLLFVAIQHTWWHSQSRAHFPLAHELLRNAGEFYLAHRTILIPLVCAFFFQLDLFLLYLGCVSFVSSPVTGVLWIVFTLMYMWLEEGVRLTLSTTCDALVGVRCYRPQEDPRPPVLAALRYTSTSLPAVAYGSLGSVPVACVCACLVAVPEWWPDSCVYASALLVRAEQKLRTYFSPFAPVHVALYGKTYPDAALDVSRVLDLDRPLVQSEVLRAFLQRCGLHVGILLGVFIGMATHSVGLGVGSCLFGTALLATCFTPVCAFVETTLVCYCEDPQSVRQVRPVLHDTLGEASLAAQGLGPNRPGSKYRESTHRMLEDDLEDPRDSLVGAQVHSSLSPRAMKKYEDTAVSSGGMSSPTMPPVAPMPTTSDHSPPPYQAMETASVVVLHGSNLTPEAPPEAISRRLSISDGDA